MKPSECIDTAELAAAAEIANVGKCGSCGKNERVPGFSMCVPCRQACGLPVEESAIAEFERERQAEQAKRDEQVAQAHQRFAKKGESTMTMKRKCQECGREFDTAQGLALHRTRVHKPKKAVEGSTVLPEPRVVEAHCSELEECVKDTAHTPCGADPCELVPNTEPLPSLLNHVEMPESYPMQEERVDTGEGKIGKLSLHVSITQGDRPFRDELIERLTCDAFSWWPSRRNEAIARLVELARQ